jgi:small Trp-rich protein
MSVWILLVGLVAAGLKYAEIAPFAKLSWWWISVPFIIVVFIWEVLTPLLGLDKKKEHEDVAKAKAARQAKNRSGVSKQ